MLIGYHNHIIVYSRNNVNSKKILKLRQKITLMSFTSKTLTFNDTECYNKLEYFKIKEKRGLISNLEQID